MCHSKSTSFRCTRGEVADGIQVAQLYLTNITNLNYINIMSGPASAFIPITVHRVNQADSSVKKPYFLVDSNTKLDVCPNVTTVTLTWSVIGNVSDALGFNCHDYGMQRCNGVYHDLPAPGEKCQITVTETGFIHEITVHKTSWLRLMYYTCSLEAYRKHSLTYIVDWIGPKAENLTANLRPTISIE
ncbi:hypothetical protein SprV_0301025200 [Sparganum proliferum]